MGKRSRLEAAAIAAAFAIAAVGWADVTGRVVAHGGPLGIARSWRMHRINAFMQPWTAPRVERASRANG